MSTQHTKCVNQTILILSVLENQSRAHYIKFIQNHLLLFLLSTCYFSAY